MLPDAIVFQFYDACIIVRRHGEKMTEKTFEQGREEIIRLYDYFEKNLL